MHNFLVTLNDGTVLEINNVRNSEIMPAFAEWLSLFTSEIDDNVLEICVKKL